MAVRIKSTDQVKTGNYRVINYKKDDFMAIKGVKDGKHITDKHVKVVHKYLAEKLIKKGVAVQAKGVELEEVINPYRSKSIVPDQK